METIKAKNAQEAIKAVETITGLPLPLDVQLQIVDVTAALEGFILTMKLLGVSVEVEISYDVKED